jgi:outer membrane murein-binding lipoprotein Lpp
MHGVTINGEWQKRDGERSLRINEKPSPLLERSSLFNNHSWRHKMRDLIIGIVIGTLLMLTGLSSFNLTNRVSKVEANLQMLRSDVDRIALKVGPLPERGRKW